MCRLVGRSVGRLVGWLVGWLVDSPVFPPSVESIPRETGRRLYDRFAECLRSVRNNDVDKPVARHFNAANHSISDIKVCAISPISGGNDSRKRYEKRLIFKIGTIHPHGLNQRFSFI